jgi:hypothetical protein
MQGLVKDTQVKLFNGFYEKILNNIFCNRLGVIDSFDNVTQKANITLVDIPFKASQNQVFDPIELSKVPLMVNATQNGGLTIPIQSGDLCVVHFDDKDKDLFFANLNNQNIQKPNTTRKHDVNDCYFTYLAPRPDNDNLAEYLNNAVKLYYKTTFLKLEENKATLQASNSLLSLEASKAKLSSGQTEMTIINNLLLIKNAIMDLKTLHMLHITAQKNSTYVDNPAAPTITVQPSTTYLAALTIEETAGNSLFATP